MEVCLQREGTLVLTSDASSCIHSQLWKKMFGLPAWAKVPEGVSSKLGLGVALESSCYRGIPLESQECWTSFTHWQQWMTFGVLGYFCLHVNRSPAGGSGRSSKQSLLWTCIFSCLSVNTWKAWIKSEPNMRSKQRKQVKGNWEQRNYYEKMDSETNFSWYYPHKQKLIFLTIPQPKTLQLSPDPLKTEKR